jgi:hypothetical protein
MSSNAITLYLLFQMFIANPTDTAPVFPVCDVNGTVQDIVTRVGSCGDKHHKMGFAVGPISLNQSDDDVRKIIAQSFAIARRSNMAVAFHLDDHMFWEKRSDLVSDGGAAEWIDWNATKCTGRRLDWGPQPTKVGPQLCFNSPQVKQAIAKRAHLIGGEIEREYERLKGEGREELFAGVITGWETQIGHDYATGKPTGYHALHNAGLTQQNSAAQCDAALAKIVQEFIAGWSRELGQCGLPRNKLYSHIAFTDQGVSDERGERYAQRVGFAVPQVAFCPSSTAGFSTYPMDDSIEQITKEVVKNGNVPWASCEGTNVVPNGVKGEATMESYLAKMFNHGAVMVNIFSWGIGGDAQKNNMFRRATENDEAIAAYRKFLGGKVLRELPRAPNQFSPKLLQEKIHRIQAIAPSWVQRTGRPDLLEPLMKTLDAALKTNRFEDADRAADSVLRLLTSGGG